MASFNRAQYQAIYDFVLSELCYWESRDSKNEARCVQIMHWCEDVIGQQSDFPEWAREAYPKGEV